MVARIEERIPMPRITATALVLAIAGSALTMGTSAVAQSSQLSAAIQARAGDRVPRVYFLPMAGQMGTDIHPATYPDIIRDIRSVEPDLIVFVLEGSDPDGAIRFHEQDPRPERSLTMFDEYRDVVRIFRDDLRDIPQVMWVENAVGFSSLIAMAWPDLYMKSDGKLAGLRRVFDNVAGWSDVEVRRKMLAAWVGIANGFLERGGHPLAIGDAMMIPEKLLSVSFEGRKVTWRLDADGHWIIDGSDRTTATFPAKLAEDVGLARGIADEPEDLLFLLGFREFESVGDGERLAKRYVEDWRRGLDQVDKLLRDYLDAMRYAQGQDEQRYLGQAIAALQGVQNQMRRHPAVAIRAQSDYGVDSTQIDIWIEQIRERIRAIRQRGRAGAGGGGGMGGGGGIGGAPRR